jgi:hypothetical protein
MFGRSRPVFFEPHGRRRRAGPPRWLVLLLVGIAIGAAAVVVVQERYLPRRLSAEASTQLRDAFEHASAERASLRREVDQTAQRLATALAERQRLAGELATSRATAAGLQDDLAAAVDALPADPRGGAVQVRAARFTTARDGSLSYEVVLTREHAAGKPLTGQMQLLVAGAAARGPDPHVTLTPIAFTLASRVVLRGSAALPEGFRPRQSTIQLLDRGGGKTLGMRVLRVERGASD